MKKTLLLSFALFLSAMTFAARYELPLGQLGSSGWGGFTTDGNGSVTYVDAWTGAGWWLESNDVPADFSAYKKVVVNFEALPFPVRIVVEYDGASSSQVDVSAGETQGELNLNVEGASKVTQVYLQSGNSGVGTIVVTEAYFTDESGDIVEPSPSAIIDFESDQLGQVYPGIAWSPGDLSAVVENNPAGEGKALHIVNYNWNSYPKFSVALPDGKTLADVAKITFKLYFESVETVEGQTPNSWKSFDYFFGAPGSSFTPNAATGNTGNIVSDPADNPGQTWLTKEFVPTIPDATLLSLNNFDFGFGLGINAAGNYFLDDITFVMKGDVPDFEVVSGVLVAYHGAGGDVVIPDDLGITAIGYNVFNNNTSITSVVIPEGVTTIGYAAFAGCSNLTSVAFPSTLETIDYYVFESCPLNSITIPNSVKSIGNQAFSYCFNLQSVLIPNSVESIGDYAFLGCWSLSAIDVDANNPNYSSIDGALYNKSKTILNTYPAGKQTNSLIIPNSVTDILPSAFWGSSLTSVTIPNSVTSIGVQAFGDCTNLTDVSVNWTTPLSLSASDDIFVYLNSACSLYVPAGTKSLYEAADVWKDFGTIEEQSPVTGVTLEGTAIIPVNYTLQLTATVEPRNASDKNVTWSSNNESVATVSTSGLVTSISEGTATITATTEEGGFSASCTVTVANSDFVVAGGILIGYRGAGGDVVIPDSLGITAIADYVFISNNAITSVSIPVGVTKIGSMVFAWCSNMTSVTIPNTVETIGDYAFAGCSITSATIPIGVTEIGNYAFAWCNNLASVVLPNTVETIGDYAFISCSFTSVTIPESVTSIGDMAFIEGFNLSEINVDVNNSNYSSVDGVLYNKDQTILYLCPEWKNANTFIIPNSVMTIASYAFYDCWRLYKIVIPASVSSIGDYAFVYCYPYNGITVYWTATPPAVSDNVFSNPSNIQLIVPAGTTSIYQETPVWQDFIITEQVPAGGLYLDNSSVYMLLGNTMQLNATIWPNNASNLNVIWSSSDESVATVSNTGIITGVNLGTATITATPEEGGYSSTCAITVANTDFVVIDNVLVAYLGTATDVVIPDDLGITEIGTDVFANNTSSITSVSIPDGVTTIDDSAFEWCYNIVSVTLPNTLTTIGDNAFYDCGLTSIKIPNSVMSIGNYAFAYNWQLSVIDVDAENTNYSSMDGVLYNKDQTELLCYPNGMSDTAFSIPTSVVTIGEGSFTNSQNLASLIIPNSVDSIGSENFNYFSNLTDVTVNWTEPLMLSPDDYIFSGVNVNTGGCTLHVPFGTKALYEAADVWKDFGAIVEEAPIYTLSVSSDSLNFVASGGQQTFAITSNTDWTVSCNVSWLTISPDSASNDGTVTVTAAENTTTSQRTAIITIIGTGVDLNGDGIVDSNDAIQINVTQDAGVETSVKNISNASFYAYFISNILKVQSANAEIITVYSATGVQLYSAKKDAGMIEIPFSSIPGSYIIKGSVSGTIKVVK